MRSCPAPLVADLAAEGTTLCRLWRVTRSDGLVLRFTDAVQDVVIGGDGTYAASPGFTCSAIMTTAASTSQNTTITIPLNAGGITENDLRGQLYNAALGELFVANWAAPADGVMQLFSGRFAGVQIGDKGRAQIELKPLTSTLRPIGWECFSATCRNAFGDSICSLGNTVVRTTLSQIRLPFTVTSVASPMTFSVRSYGLLSNPSYLYIGWAGDNHEEDEEAWPFVNTGTWAAPNTSSPGGVGDWPDVESEDGGEDVFHLPPSQVVALFVAVDNFWAGGQIQWLTGSNQGTTQNVRASSLSAMSLSLANAPLSGIQPGDTGFVFPGCDKTRTTCKVRYDNLLNFRAEPDVPSSLVAYSIPTPGAYGPGYDLATSIWMKAFSGAGYGGVITLAG